MASVNQQEGNKWINAVVVIAAVIIGYVTHSFVQQLGDWFDLEAKLSYFKFLAQAVALGAGAACFFTVVFK